MRYRICEADNVPELVKLVNQSLDEGWEPQGGMSVAYSPGSMKWWFYQALVTRQPSRRPVAGERE
jgi:hypothetical protein